MTPFRTCTIRTLAVLALLTAVAGTAHLGAQGRVGGRTLRDPGRDVRERVAREVPPPPPPPPAPLIAPGIRADSVVESPATAPPRYRFVVTPSIKIEDEQSLYGAQLAMKRKGRFPFSLALTDQLISTDGDDRISNRIQGDAELTVLNDVPVLGRPVVLALMGMLRHTQRSGTLAEASAEVDVTVIGSGNAPSVALRGIAYYDHSWPTDGDSRSGATFGTGALIALTSAVDLETEYDFKSSFVGEDDFSARLLVKLPGRRVQPTLIIGGAKHGTVLFGVRFARP
jgi:hypothetical protein